MVENLIVKRFAEYRLDEALEFTNKRGYFLGSERQDTWHGTSYIVFKNESDFEKYACFVMSGTNPYEWVRVYEK